jgi:hypothetical protein
MSRPAGQERVPRLHALPELAEASAQHATEEALLRMAFKIALQGQPRINALEGVVEAPTRTGAAPVPNHSPFAVAR